MRNREQKMLSVFCMPDHTHLLAGLKPSIAISDLARDIKAGSSNFINDSKWMSGKFNWQEGFGAFSYSRSHIDTVIKYIQNQEEHHRKKTFKEEYIDFLKKYEIKYDEKYLFEWIEKTGRSHGAKYIIRIQCYKQLAPMEPEKCKSV